MNSNNTLFNAVLAAVVAAARDASQRSTGPWWRTSGSHRSLSAATLAGRAPMTNRVAFQSLFAKFRAFSSLVAPKRWSCPGVVPWMSAKRSASAPVSSMTPSGSTTLPLVLDIF